MSQATSKSFVKGLTAGLLALTTAVAAFTVPAIAQVTVPAGAEIGRSTEPTNASISALSETSAAADSTDIQVKADDTGTSFVLKGIVVSDSTVFSADEMEAVYADYLGTKIDVGVVFKIATELTAFYRKNGYILGQVIVPPQEVDGGQIQLQAVEGYVDQLVFDGDLGSERELVHAYGEKIKASRPLRADILERYLLLAGDLAGLTVEGILAPSTQNVGASTLTIKSEYDWFEGSFAAVNTGSNEVGPTLATADATFNSILGQHERIMLRGTIAAEFSELQSIEISASAPINDDGTSVIARYAGSNSNPGNGLQTYAVNSVGSRAAVGVKHAAIRSRKENLFLTARLDVDDLRSNSNLGTLSDDHLRVIRAIADYDYVDTALGTDKPAVNTIRVTFSQGLNVLGATTSGSSNKSRTNGSGVFTALSVVAQRQQVLNNSGLQILFGARAQIANVPLLSSEEFGFGGQDYGRGYDPSAMVGDKGFAGKAELQFMHEEAASTLEILESAQYYAFVDVGMVENLNADGLGNSSYQRMWSTGIGVRLGLVNNVDMDLALAYRGNDSNSVKNFGHDRLRALVKFESHF